MNLVMGSIQFGTPFGHPVRSQVVLLPTNNSVPVITGTAQVGEVLTASNGAWANHPVSFTYRWYADDVFIVGATHKTYTPVIGQIDAVLTVGVKAHNAAGVSTEAVSDPTDAVIAA